METFAKLMLFCLIFSKCFCVQQKPKDKEDYLNSLDNIEEIGHEIAKWLDYEPIMESKLKDLKKRAVSANLAKMKVLLLILVLSLSGQAG